MAFTLALHGLPTFNELAVKLGSEDFAHIEKEGDCHRESSPEEGLIWLPDHYLASKMKNIYRQLEPGMAVEIVNFIPLEEGVSSDPDFLRQVMNQFLNVSAQKGIRYYSSSRKKDLVLIEDSFTVEESGDKKAIEDFQFDSAPGVADVVIYQKDVNFGGNYFDYHCELFADGALLTTTNRTNLTVMKFFTVAKPDENIMAYLVIPCEEGLYVYTGVFVADPPTQEKILGVSVNIQGFFRKRVTKILEWFKESFAFQS
ncbi:MAG: hypothetical protein PQJ59_15360 [Spirochaetales bacterium]|nr:hypothetical protein [Spirochaetales bacterium]